MTNIMLDLQNVPRLNSGGCGIAALAAYRKYKEMGVNPRIVYLNSTRDKTVPRISENNRNKIGTSAYHYALLVDGLGVIDSNGEVIIHEKWWCDIVRIVPESYLIKGIKGKGWNDWFDRSIGIPAIERILNVSLEDIK